VDTSNVGGGVKYGMGLLRMLWRDYRWWPRLGCKRGMGDIIEVRRGGYSKREERGIW
jgi:hypothetical protein